MPGFGKRSVDLKRPVAKPRPAENKAGGFGFITIDLDEDDYADLYRPPADAKSVLGTIGDMLNPDSPHGDCGDGGDGGGD